MKKLIIILLVFITYNSIAQQYDNIWPLGAYYGPSNTNYYSLDFSFGTPDTIVYQRKMRFFISNAAISDNSGSLQFYTNGIWIANKQHDTLFNSENFNVGWATGNYFNVGMGLSQSVLIIPFGDTSNSYYVIYENAEPFYNQDNDPDIQPLFLSYSVIDMNLDSSKGGVINTKKNIHAINDTLLLGRITACKHANGRDWWVVVHKYYSDIYYKLLFTPSGIMGPYSQQIGSVLPAKLNNGDDFDIDGMGEFSPDGTKYIQVGPSNIMDIMDFDRCTGLFSNYQSATIPINPGNTWALGCSFSSDSRYLYANTYTRAYQFDSYASNINSSMNLIAVYDSFLNPFDTWFFLNQLGPDGKIYLSTFNSSKVLHVIEYPDSVASSCAFNQHSFALPYYGTNSSLPNFPNYRLGVLTGSGCDTLTNVTSINNQESSIRISPNPNNGNFIINYSLPQNKSGTLTIYTTIGEKVYSMPLPQWSVMQQINLSSLYAGIYAVKVSSNSSIAIDKLLIVK